MTQRQGRGHGDRWHTGGGGPELALTHLSLQCAQVEQVEVAGQLRGQRVEGTQARGRGPPRGHGQGQSRGVQGRGGQVAEEGRVAGRVALWDLRDWPEGWVRDGASVRSLPLEDVGLPHWAPLLGFGGFLLP